MTIETDILARLTTLLDLIDATLVYPTDGAILNLDKSIGGIADIRLSIGAQIKSRFALSDDGSLSIMGVKNGVEVPALVIDEDGVITTLNHSSGSGVQDQLNSVETTANQSKADLLVTNTNVSNVVSALAGSDQDIAAALLSITANAQNIATLVVAVGNNTQAIADNASDIDDIETEISANAQAIADNAIDIVSNADEISINASNISDNTDDIAANVLAIGALGGGSEFADYKLDNNGVAMTSSVDGDVTTYEVTLNSIAATYADITGFVGIIDTDGTATCQINVTGKGGSAMGVKAIVGTGGNDVKLGDLKAGMRVKFLYNAAANKIMAVSGFNTMKPSDGLVEVDPAAARAALAVGKPRIAMTLEATPAYNSDILKWDTQNGQEDITYDAATGVFTFHTAGRYRYHLDLFFNGGVSNRIIVGHNTLTPTRSSNIGHAYNPGSTAEGMISLSRPFLVAAGETFVVYRYGGNLFSDAVDNHFGALDIEFIG